MNTDKIKMMNMAFGNCLFMSKEPKSVEHTIFSKTNDPNICVFGDKLNEIKVENVDEYHSKLSLTFDNGEVLDGTITWRKSTINDKNYVFTSFE